MYGCSAQRSLSIAHVVPPRHALKPVPRLTAHVLLQATEDARIKEEQVAALRLELYEKGQEGGALAPAEYTSSIARVRELRALRSSNCRKKP